MGRGVKLALLAAAAGVAILLLVLLRPAGGEDKAEPTGPATMTENTVTERPTTNETANGEASSVVQAEIVVRGDDVSGPERVDLVRGQRLVLVVRSNIADHVHVHGYDLLLDVGPGQPARFSFRADAPGRFEVELEARAQPLTTLVVSA